MTSLGIDLADLGFAPIIDAPEQTPAEPANDGRTLVVGSALAKALYSVWSGTPITIVDSPPADGIHVGTADKMQGGQWHAVVAMDPFIGYTLGRFPPALPRPPMRWPHAKPTSHGLMTATGKRPSWTRTVTRTKPSSAASRSPAD